MSQKKTQFWILVEKSCRVTLCIEALSGSLLRYIHNPSICNDYKNMNLSNDLIWKGVSKIYDIIKNTGSGGSFLRVHQPQ